MKASPNREQQLFLTTGGILLVLILGVVVFNVLWAPKPEKEIIEIKDRPQIKVNVDQDEGDTRKSWSSREVKPAPMFARKPPAKLHKPEIPKAPPEQRSEVWSQSVKRPTDAPAKKVADVTEGLVTESVKKATSLPPTPPPPTQRKAPASSGVITLKPLPPPTVVVKKPESGSTAAPATQPAPVVQSTAGPATASGLEPAAEQVSPLYTLPTTPPPRMRAGVNRPQPKPPTRPKAPVLVQPTKQTNDVSPTRVAGLTTPVREGHGYSVQLGSFGNGENAGRLVQKVAGLSLNGRGLPANKASVNVNGKTYHRVRVGPFSTKAEAERVLMLIRGKGLIAGGRVMPPGR
ncbi:MAG: SPOR domain-containing protein [Magnetococcales bacterium]|nr:SPOR domain-containing protein [Magnetococcales bacterium]